MSFEILTNGFAQTRKALEAEAARIKRNSGAATKAYAQEVAAVAKAMAPKRKRMPSAKGIAKHSTSTLAPEPVVRANLAGHVKVYGEGTGFGISPTSAKVKLTGHVWHLITGDVKAHEENAGTFRGAASGRRAMQMLDGYAARTMHPAHTGHHAFLQEAKSAAHPAAMVRARAALRKP